MKNKFIVGFVSLFILCSLFGSLTVSAASNRERTAAAQAIFDGIVASKQVDSPQDWINGDLTERAGISSEWYILALAQSGDYDFSAYEAALIAYLEQNEIRSASSRLKFALILSAIGSTNEYIQKTVDESIGQQGILSLVYGLHLLNNRYTCELYTLDELKASLLALQHEDGGWSVSGTVSDADVTAMAIQALAPYYTDEPAVGDSIDQALEWLSDQQLEEGGYVSYGLPNPESTAQVLVALASLGIDCTSDQRFIRNGRTLFDAITKYRLPDGSFCHAAGGNFSETATAQVFYAMVAYQRMADGETPLYILDSRAPEAVPPPNGSVDGSPPSETAPSTSNDRSPGLTQPNLSDGSSTQTAGSQNDGSSFGYKPWVCLIVLVLSAAGGLFLFIIRKRHIKNYIVLLIATAAVLVIVCLTDFQSADNYYNGEAIEKDNTIGSVKMTIRCDTVVGKSDSEFIPSDGVILELTEFEIEEGDTVYDILVEAAQKYGIQLENNGSAEMVYIAGINYLYELDFGDLSGWVYHVNGSAQSVGCGQYKLSDGDTVEWLYSCELGNDLN